MDKDKKIVCQACCKSIIPKRGIRVVGAHQSLGTTEPFFYQDILVCPECGERGL